MWSDPWADVTLPAWTVLALATLAAWAILRGLVLPLIGAIMRWRSRRAVARLNSELALRIQPFKLVSRKVLIDRLLFDPDVMAAADRHAAETGVPREQAMAKVASYVREIVPSFSAYTYFRIGARLARKVSEGLYRVRLGYANEAALEAVPPDASVVFVINHRSNMDYVLVTYVASRTSALSYAVGEWAQVWGLRGLIRSMGAYFIRRNSKDPLYRRVLARYVDTATKAGVVQAIFPEGGLSRDGTLRPPKLGLLAYIVQGFDPNAERDVVFIPVGVNYDRVLEDRVLTSAAETPAGEAPRFRFNPLVFTHFILHNIWLMLRGHWHRYGYACVSFGDPMSLKGYLAGRRVDLRTLGPEARQAEIERIGQDLMSAVGKVVPALPVSIVSTVLLEAGGTPLHLFELKGRVFQLMTALEQAGAHLHIPRADRDYSIEVGLRMLHLRHLVQVDGDSYRANPKELTLLRYYANAIAHLMPGAHHAAAASAAAPGA